MQRGTSNLSAVDSLPEGLSVNLLESFLPGFGVIRRFLIASFGFDITLLVTTCLILVATIGGANYFWRRAFEVWEEYLTSSITINSNDKLHEQVMQWISKNALTKKAKSLSASTKTNRRGGITAVGRSSTSTGNFNFADWDANMPPVFSPYFGAHFLWFKGRLFIFRREKQRQNEISLLFSQQGGDERETLRLACFGRSAAPIKELLQHCKIDYAAERRELTTIRGPSIMRGTFWHSSTTRLSRPLDTIYMDQTVKSELLQDVFDFLQPNAPKYYSLRGIPYRRGYLFHGPPGTGKTSLSLAIAGTLGLDLYILSLSERELTDEKLNTLFTALPDHCIVLLEDIDTVGLERRDDLDVIKDKAESKEDQEAPNPPKRFRTRGSRIESSNEPKGVSLSGVLNAIDGVASPEGRILIMTTNDPESLDKALIRPGRVDLQVYFGHVNKENARQIFTRMFTPDSELEDQKEPGRIQTNQSTDAKTSMAELVELAAKFAEALPEEKFTPAEVQGFLLTRRRSPKKALDEVEAWRDEVLAAKDLGKNIIASKSSTAEEHHSANGAVPLQVTGEVKKNDGTAEATTVVVNGTDC